MSRIDDNLDSLVQFAQDLNSGKSVSCKKNGKWKCDGARTRFCAWLFHTNDARVIKVAKVFEERLDALEKIPVFFNCGAIVHQNQKQKFEAYLSAAQAVEKALKKSNSSKCKEELAVLSLRIIGLKYRIEAEHKGCDALQKADPTQLAQLEKVASAWKTKQKLIPKDQKALTAFEKSQLEKTCLYPEFAALLLIDPKLQEDYFKWILRDLNGIKQFIEFPSTCKRLKLAFLTARVGFFGGDLLSIKKKNIESKNPSAGQQKLIRLPFETEDGLKAKNISILDESQLVTLRGGWQLSIKKVIDIFAEKKFDSGNLEFFGKAGIKNWNCPHLGWWNPKKGPNGDLELIDLNAPKWWTLLPEFERLSKAELEKRYQLPALKDNEWVAIPRSSRESLHLDIAKSHGFMEVAVPQADGTYLMFDFGKFAAVWPRTNYEAFDFLAKTEVGKINYPDESVFYTHRQHAAIPFLFSEEKGLKLMELIREDLIKARNGNVIFQFTWENCSFWPQALMDKMLGKASQGGQSPNLFITPLTSVTAPKPVGYIFKLYRALPAKLQPKYIRILEFILNSNRGVWVTENGAKVYKCTAKCDFRKEQKTYQPGFLHHQILQKKLNGVVWTGVRSKG